MTQGLPWQPDFIEVKGRSRRITFTLASSLTPPPQSFPSTPPYSALSGWPSGPRSPFVARLSFTLCSGLSQSLYKGLGREWGAGEGSSTRTGCLRLAATNPERARPPAWEDS